jgi:hypothetical protein
MQLQASKAARSLRFAFDPPAVSRGSPDLMELDHACYVARYELIRAVACVYSGHATDAFLMLRIQGDLQHRHGDHS